MFASNRRACDPQNVNLVSSVVCDSPYRDYTTTQRGSIPVSLFNVSPVAYHVAGHLVSNGDPSCRLAVFLCHLLAVNCIL